MTAEKKSPAISVKSIISRLTSHRVLSFIGCVAIIAVVAFIFFFPDAYEGNSLRQHDMQQGIAIGQEAKAFAEQTGEVTRWTNSLFSGMPTFQISPSYPSTALFSWINTLMGLGLPSPSQLLAMMMTGFLILMFALRMRWPVALLGAFAYGFSSYFIIIIGAGHIWKFLTLAYVPPTIAGIILCYRGRYLAGGALAALFAMMQIAQNHVQMTYYFLFVIVGVIIAMFCSAIRHKQLKQWGIATGVLAVAAALAVTANLPSLYNTYEYSKETMRGRHSELTQPASPEAASTQGLDKNYITQYSYQPSETFSLLIPNIKGGASAKPEKGNMVAVNLAQLPDADKLGEMEKQYVSYMSQYFGDPEGTNGPVYAGALIMSLALMAVIIRRREALTWALVALTLFSIVLSWGRHAMAFTDLMLAVVPMYGKFRTVESILVIAEFTIPLLAALGLQKIFSTPAEQRTGLLKPAAWSFGICAFFCLAAIVSPSFYGSVITDNDRYIDRMITASLIDQGISEREIMNMFSLNSPQIYNAVVSLRENLIRTDALRSLTFIAVGFIALFFYFRGKLNMGFTVAVLAVATFLDLYTVDKRYVNHDSFVTTRYTTAAAPIAKTPVDEYILSDTTMNYRVMDIPRFQSADPSYYHKMIGGYHAAKLTRYQDLIDRHLSNFLRGEPNDADWNVLNMLNTRYVVDGQGPMLNPEAQGNAWFADKIIYVNNPDQEMDALSQLNLRSETVADRRFADMLGTATPKAESDTIFETTYAPNRLTYHYERATDGIAVFSEVYFPWGWKATVDGNPVEIGRVNYLLRAIRVPAGSHSIEMTFDPESLHTTDTAATIAIILIYIALAAAAAWWLTGRRKKKSTETNV